ncbi:OsmC family protein [Kribbella sp. NBC_01245]|uniref:OsmC family protein n=1 Tax=Kribbella sp. NBC_01245 TaxID=2903578 RepID=UPI002E2A68BB|nr:OsmC family protein [Kribbella sp. NBC_01245]
MADTERSVSIERVENSRYLATNVRGGKLSIGSGKDDDFTPVELLLAAIGACSAIDVDVVVSRRAEPDEFTVVVRGDKIRDDAGNRMENLDVAFTVHFPDGPEGDTAREALPRAAKMSHDRLCTVSRTVEIATPVTITVNP